MDQVAALEANDIPVETINSTTPFPKRRAIIEDLLSDHPETRLLYVTPELCQTENFRQSIMMIHAHKQLNRIVVDEAHCISEWGHDFRPAYQELSWFKKTLTNPPPITAVTATATPRVRRDIVSMLGLDQSTLKTFQSSSARPNIHYEVRYLTAFAQNPIELESSQVKDILSWLKDIQSRRVALLGSNSASDPSDNSLNNSSHPPISGIIYVPLRSVCEKLASALSASSQNINAVAYHAGLASEARSQIQATWMSREHFPPGPDDDYTSFSIIVATTAFGMGIDNPHVRFVIHWTPPRSFEGLVQESGRAGRDGRAAISVVYYNPEERSRVIDRITKGCIDNIKPKDSLRGRSDFERRDQKKRSQQARLESFEKVVEYCETTTRCRHEIIKEYSGDLDLESKVKVEDGATSPCDFACDFCKLGTKTLTIQKKRMHAVSAAHGYDISNDSYGYGDPSWLGIMSMMFGGNC